MSKKTLITKEELYDLYIVKNMNYIEISKIYDCSYQTISYYVKKYEIKKDKKARYDKMMKTNLERYGTPTPVNSKKTREKTKQTNLEKYGVEYIFNLPEFQEKAKNTKLEKYGTYNVMQNEEIKEKRNKTNLERYGSIFPLVNSEEVKFKREQTNIKKYGVKTPLQSEEIKLKIKLTNLEKYGKENPMQNEDIKQKVKITNMKKYGVACTLYNPEIRQKTIKTNISRYGTKIPSKNNKIKQKIANSNLVKYGNKCTLHSKKMREKIKKIFLEKYGVPYPCMRKECREASGTTISKINKNFSEKLKLNSIKNKLEFNLENYSYDIEILDTDILIEINPTYTHNSTNIFYAKSTKGKKPKENNYHQNKTLIAQKNGYRCIHVWDWDDQNKIINMLKPKQRIYARDCEIKKIEKDDIKEFEHEHHLQGYCNHQDIRLGLYYNGVLVEIMTFGKPRYNKNYEWELIRLCSHNEYIIIGGSEKLFKSFIEEYNPKSIISYCDNSKFDGKVYNKLGFELKDFGKPSKHWYNIKTKKHITDNLLRQLGYDILFNTNYGKGTNNEELMKENGFVEVYDSGQSTYIYKV